MTKFLTGIIVILLAIAIVGVSVTASYHSDMSAVREHTAALAARWLRLTVDQSSMPG